MSFLARMCGCKAGLCQEPAPYALLREEDVPEDTGNLLGEETTEAAMAVSGSLGSLFASESDPLDMEDGSESKLEDGDYWHPICRICRDYIGIQVSVTQPSDAFLMPWDTNISLCDCTNNPYHIECIFQQFEKSTNNEKWNRRCDVCDSKWTFVKTNPRRWIKYSEEEKCFLIRERDSHGMFTEETRNDVRLESIHEVTIPMPEAYETLEVTTSVEGLPSEYFRNGSGHDVPLDVIYRLFCSGGM